MKNVQVIDGAVYCTFPVFQFTDEQFSMIFPDHGQDIAFIEDVFSRLTQTEQEFAFAGVWNRPVDKQEIIGLHGTLFYGFEDRKEHFPETGRECDWNDSAVNQAQRELNALKREHLKE